MDDNDKNRNAKSVHQTEAIRFLLDPETAKLFAALRGTSLEEAMDHLRAVAETVEEERK